MNRKSNKKGVLDSSGGSGPWKIENDHSDRSSKTREVTLVCTDTTEHTCPKCSQLCAFYDLRGFRQWRHLNTGTYRTVLRARVPRIICPEHGILTVLVSWASPSSRFTFGFEKEVVVWGQETSISGVARQMDVGWGAIAGIMQNAVK